MLREMIQALSGYVDFNRHKGEPGYKPAMPLNYPRPNYTTEAWQHHVQGIVKLAVLVDERCKIPSMLTLSSLGYALDEEARYAAKQVKFAPATKDGNPILYWQP